MIDFLPVERNSARCVKAITDWCAGTDSSFCHESLSRVRVVHDFDACMHSTEGSFATKASIQTRVALADDEEIGTNESLGQTGVRLEFSDVLLCPNK